jgi:hypothetical protein
LQRFCRNISTFNALFPQEKVYLHLDNTGYFSGETLWYKAYVIRTDTGRYTDLSSVLYVELVDPFGEIIETQKLKIENGRCHGDISLTAAHVDGFYELRAYTRYNTNWNSAGIYSRVLPVFKKPSTDGDYSQMHIRRDFRKYRQGDDIPDSLTLKELRHWNRGPSSPTVTFYPEGGHLVRGLMNKVAFEVSYPDSVSVDMRGDLRTSSGESLSSVSTLREGRGTFLCVPDTQSLSLHFRHEGKSYTFPLPAATPDGCVLAVDAVSSSSLTATVTSTPSLYGQTLGLTVMRNGNILYFGTHTMDATPWELLFERSELPGGVLQLTLFDASGRIYSQRSCFIPPHVLSSPSDTLPSDVVPLRAEVQDDEIAPYRRMTLRLQGPAGEVVSVAVRDASTTTNACRENACTYLLLSSELKGYVRDADYYFERDDVEHRLAADLLCLVQGWTRYDWQTMAGLRPFEKYQPLEDGLYLDGRLYPRIGNFRGNFWMSPRARRRTRAVEDVQLSAVLYNEEGQSLRGRTVTDSAGYFAFRLPDVSGDWTVQLHTTKDDREQSQVIAINRLFQPACKTYNYYELQLQPAPSSVRRFRYRESDYGEALTALRDSTSGWYGNTLHQLGEAVVQVKGRRWSYLDRLAIDMSHVHYDMVKEADKYADRGEGTPLLFDWLMTKKVYHDEFFKNNRGIGWYQGGSHATFSLRDKQSKRFRISQYNMGTEKNPHHVSGSVEVTYSWYHSLAEMSGFDMTVQSAGGCPDLFLDDIKSLYISMEHGVTDFMAPYERSFLSQFDPFHVYIRTLPYHKDSKSIRHTYLQGYNLPHTFQMNDYSVMPHEPDFRRTLYWNPDVALGATGTAELVFYNNTTARQCRVSAEGITSDAKVMVAE